MRAVGGNRLRAQLVSGGVNLLIAGSILGSAMLLYFYDPGLYLFCSLEDGVFEYGSFVAWATASGLFLWMGVRAPGKQKVACFVIAVVAIVLAMEEISWGQRLFGWESGEYFRAKNRQSETNLHNLFNINQIYKPAALFIILACVIPWTGVRLSTGVRRLFASWALPVITPKLWPIFLLVAILLSRNPVPRALEFGELVLAIAVALLAVDLLIYQESTPRSLWRIVLAPALVVATILVGTAAITSASPAEYEVAVSTRLNQSALDQFRKGRFRQAEQIFDFIWQHPKYRRDDTDFYYGILLYTTGRTNEARAVLTHFLQETDLNVLTSSPGEEDLVSGRMWRFLGYSHCVVGSWEVAESYFAEAVKSDRARLAAFAGTTREADARSSLSSSLMATGSYREARLEHRQALDSAASPSIEQKVRARRQMTRSMSRLVYCPGS